jgi:transcriptional regulator with XRE-family HTH domain
MPPGYGNPAAVRRASSNIRKILATNVREYRGKHGLSQEGLADQCELHRTYIGSIERCERNVTLSTLEVLADALRVSVTDLLTRR